MSLNIVDSFLDKLSLVSKDRNTPLGKKFTGSQNFLGTNSYGLSQSIPAEFSRAFMEPDYLTQAHNRMNRSSSLDSKMNYFEPSSERLVSRVSKLYSPVYIPQDCFRVALPSVEILQDQEILNCGVKVFCEEMEQQLDMLTKMFVPNLKYTESASPPFGVESPNKQRKASNSVSNSDKDKCHQPNMTSSVDNPPNQSCVLKSDISSNVEFPLNNLKESSPHLKSDKETTQTNFNSGTKGQKTMMQDAKILNHSAAVSKKSDKQLKNNNQAMNRELTNRKNKELQKRSKKRRRRQKKINVLLDKESATKPKVEVSASQANSRSNNSAGSDILCDITIAECASSVQILLPNSSSFVISIESAEEDSDWDSNSDCDWLTDCSEFELSGIFISNLSTPLSSRDLCISHLNVQLSRAEEAEMRHLGAALRRVNKDWMESTKGLDTKPKVATKVSFAPDDELVEVVHVDIYERKGEWETYATERMRFKRRIDELDKIISPCLSKEHREKVFLRLQDSNL